MSHDPGAVCYIAHERTDADGRKRPWPKPPKAPAWVSRQPRRDPPRIGAHAGGPKMPLEVFSRLAGGTTYRTPEAGRSTKGAIGVDDLAHALGFVRDPLEQRLARALACRSASEWAQVQELAVPVLRKQLLASHNTRAAVAGAMRFRIRLVLHDVFHDLTLDRPAREPAQSAARIDMPVRDYRALYKAIAGFVETKAQAGAYAAKCALYNE